jgi:hypothetical protein
MDFYILLFGTKKDITLLRKHMSHKDEDVVYDSQAIFKSYSSFFWFYAAQSLYSANQKCNRHLLHLTQQFEYRGLSRVGRQLGSYFGVFPAFRNQEIRKAQFAASYTKKIQEMVENNDGIITWDNYCHQYGSPTPSASRDINYKQANYTVVAVTAYNFHVRPSFVWRYLDDINTCVVSVPRDPAALLPAKPLVNLTFLSPVSNFC